MREKLRGAPHNFRTSIFSTIRKSKKIVENRENVVDFSTSAGPLDFSNAYLESYTTCANI